MRTRTLRPRTLAAALLATVTLTGTLTATGAASAAAPPAEHAAAGGTAAQVGRIEDGTARALAVALADSAFGGQVRAAALAGGDVDLQDLAGRAADASLSSRVRTADQRIARAKGLDHTVGSLLRLRLGDASMRTALTAGAEPLVAAAGASDDSATVTAYDSRGRAHRLDARHLPAQPVYVVDLDGGKAVAAGMDVLRRTFAADGLSAAVPAVRSGAGTVADTAAGQAAPQTLTAGGWYATKIDSIRLNDDMEPWIKGDAEIFSLVTGFGLDGKVRVDSVDMPYLNDEDTTYYPNQILINWSSYKYNLADMVMMEEDTGTNYKALAEAVAAALLTITDQGTYIPLVNAVMDALPDSFWTDDADYVDSWYTLARTSSGRLYGAAGNGWMSVSSYFVSEL